MSVCDSVSEGGHERADLLEHLVRHRPVLELARHLEQSTEHAVCELVWESPLCPSESLLPVDGRDVGQQVEEEVDVVRRPRVGWSQMRAERRERDVDMRESRRLSGPKIDQGVRISACGGGLKGEGRRAGAGREGGTSSARVQRSDTSVDAVGWVDRTRAWTYHDESLVVIDVCALVETILDGLCE